MGIYDSLRLNLVTLYIWHVPTSWWFLRAYTDFFAIGLVYVLNIVILQ